MVLRRSEATTYRPEPTAAVETATPTTLASQLDVLFGRAFPDETDQIDFDQLPPNTSVHCDVTDRTKLVGIRTIANYPDRPPEMVIFRFRPIDFDEVGKMTYRLNIWREKEDRYGKIWTAPYPIAYRNHVLNVAQVDIASDSAKVYPHELIGSEYQGFLIQNDNPFIKYVQVQSGLNTLL